MSLYNVEDAAQQADAARQALKRAVRRAIDEGAAVTAVAAAAGVGRQTIYRWLAEETGEFVGRPVDALRAALGVLAGAISDPRAAGEVRRRLNGSEVSLTVAYQIASDALGRQALQERPEDETRMALAAATAAIERLDRR